MKRSLAALGLGLGCLAAGAARAEPGTAIPRPFHVIAHRGASAYAPENTLPAFSRALEIGVIEVELDVQLSRDSVPVVFHDDTLEPKTPLRGRVREHPVSELTRAEIGSWFDRAHPDATRRWAGTKLVTLAEVFAAFGAKLHYHVEIKDELEQTPARVLAAIAAAGLADHVTLTSFQRVQLERARRIDPRVPACWLLKQEPRGQLDAAKAAGFAMVGVRASELDREIVSAAHARGLEIRAFAVESSESALEQTLASGANGMTIDVPERLVARLLALLAAPAAASSD